MAKAKNGFTCSTCGDPFGDDLYHGPEGHAPQTMCLDCWANEWNGGILMSIAAEREWRPTLAALWLVANGHTHAEAAEMVGKSSRTLRRWRVKLKKTVKIPSLVSENGQVVHGTG